MGFAHHSGFATWFEMGRSEMLRLNGISYREFEEQGHLLPVVDLRIRYKKPARYDDILRLVSHMTEITRAKIVFEYKLFRDDELLATGRTVNACIDRKGDLQPIPESIFQAFKITPPKRVRMHRI